MARMKIIFDGFADLAADIDRVGGDLKKATEEALTETQKLVQSNLTHAAAPYATKGVKGYAEGDMYDTIKKDSAVQWTGSVASIGVGFELYQKGGWHSIFIMYGTPRISKDQRVYNAIKGSKTKKQIAAKQEEIMRKYLSLEGNQNG